MTIRRGVKRATGLAVVAMLVATTLLVTASSADVGARAPRTIYEGGADLIAQNGFGDFRNSYAWSTAWFRGKLYVGTSREEVCVENETVDFYLVVSGRYTTKPLPNTHCPANPYDMDLRAEIWQYTPSTGHWVMVYQSPTIPNPRARGKRVARDIAYRGMLVDHGQLYIGDVTADEYIPELSRKYPPRMLVTTDGVHFRSVSAQGVVARTLTGVHRPMGVRSMLIWRGRMFVTLSASLTGDGAVFEVMRPWSSHPGFAQVSPHNLDVFEMQVFGGSLYIGTGDSRTGYGVYRINAHYVKVKSAFTAVGRRHTHPVRWVRRYGVTPVVTVGAGRGNAITSVVSMHVFHNWLYVGASGWYNPQNVPYSEMIRIRPSGQWQVVAGVSRMYDGTTKAPISGLGDGFSNIFTAHFWRMATFDGALYVGTNDWSYLVQLAFPKLDPTVVGILQSALSSEYGFDLWASCDGRDWFPVTHDAFGSANMYDFGARVLVPTPAGLFIGSANQAQGTKIWRVDASPCDSLVNARRKIARVATPQALLADSQRKGTVVSWAAAAHATSYTVMRASYVSAPLTVAPPPTLPGGFTMDNQVPNIVSPGTPGAAEDNLTIPENFVPIATTASTFYVDHRTRPGKRYLYQVIADGPSGQQSLPSAVQAAPDPRPAPTLEQVLRAAGRAAGGALAAMVAVDNRRHDRRAILAVLSRLRRLVGAGSDAGILIERLERRIEYANLAGGD